MRSIHSKQDGGRLLVEDCLTLDLAWLMRLGPIRAGQAGSGDVNWSIDGVPVAALRFRLDLRATETAQLVLCYTLAMQRGKRKPMRQVIALTALPQHLGGRRWRLLCPVTGERSRVLYLQPGGERFASRKALGLAYQAERLNRFDRPFEKLLRAQRRLGNVQGLGAGLTKPKGMWQRTFARHVAGLEQNDLACAKKIATMIGSA